MLPPRADSRLHGIVGNYDVSAICVPEGCSKVSQDPGLHFMGVLHVLPFSLAEAPPPNMIGTVALGHTFKLCDCIWGPCVSVAQHGEAVLLPWTIL